MATEAQDRVTREAENASRLPLTEIQAQPSPVLWAPHRAVIKVLAVDGVPSRWPGEGLHVPSGRRPPATSHPRPLPRGPHHRAAHRQRGSRRRRSKDTKTRFFKTEMGLNLYIFQTMNWPGERFR